MAVRPNRKSCHRGRQAVDCVASKRLNQLRRNDKRRKSCFSLSVADGFCPPPGISRSPLRASRLTECLQLEHIVLFVSPASPLRLSLSPRFGCVILSLSKLEMGEGVEKFPNGGRGPEEELRLRWGHHPAWGQTRLILRTLQRAPTWCTCVCRHKFQQEIRLIGVFFFACLVARFSLSRAA